MPKRNLDVAKRVRNDEFYTPLNAIEDEMRHYRSQFSGEVIYCNCDDPFKSNFFKHFGNNYEFYGLAKLVTTCYKSTDAELFSRHKETRGLMLEYTGDKNGNRVADLEEVSPTLLESDGDFRSRECIELLKKADIVSTNPPFSLFREYIAQLIAHDKKFIVLGPTNAIFYKEIAALFRENKIWLGVGSHGMHFITPSGEMRHINAVWFTNMSHKKRQEELLLYKKYHEADYPKYDNFDAIEVSKTKNIPMDYPGLMGVPITFLDKYNPAQFEIVGTSREVGREPGGKGDFRVNGKIVYARIVIRNRRLQP